jgi:hypothetical protein
VYYVRVKTRSSGAAARGSPAKALEYITDGHDERRDTTYSNAEIAYIARLGDGWKTQLEGGRVPLFGLGDLAQQSDQAVIAALFEQACQPYHDPRATTGYKSFTFTLPKELSLLAEGNRAEAERLMTEAVRRSLDRVFQGLRYSGVSALHTRNESGEVHYHLHVLVAKFAHFCDTGRRFSLNQPKFARLGPAALRAIKLAWKEEVDGLVKERFGVSVEQSRHCGPVTLLMPDGARLEPLNRDSRRVLDIALRPMVSGTSRDGHATAPRPFEIKVMDDEIFEVAAGMKGVARWNREVFQDLFPAKAKFIGRYDKRAESLKRVGYLTSEGEITPAFRLHYAARKGPLLPELQSLRIELARELTKDPATARGGKKPKLEQVVARHREVLQSLGILGVPTTSAAAGRSKPEPPRTSLVDRPSPSDEPREAQAAPRDARLASTRNDLSDPADRMWAAVDRLEHLRRRLERLDLRPADVGMAFAAADALRPTKENLARARAAQRPVGPRRGPAFLRGLGGAVAMPADQETRDMQRLGMALGGFFQVNAHNRRPQVSHRPMFNSVTVSRRLAQTPTLLQHALARLFPIARFDARKLIVAPFLARQVQAAERKLPREVPAEAKLLLTRGIEVLEQHQPSRIRAIAAWKSNPARLAELVVQQARGEARELSVEQYSAAVRAGQVGRLLQRERAELAAPKSVRPPPPISTDRMASELRLLAARLKAHALPDDFVRQFERHGAAEKLLASFREQRLLSPGPAWTLERERFSKLTHLAREHLKRPRSAEKERDR